MKNLSLASPSLSLCLGFLAGAAAGAASLFGLPALFAVVVEEVLKAGALFAVFSLKRFPTGFRAAANGLSAGIGFGLAELANYFIVYYYHDLSLLLFRLPPLAMHAFTAAILGYALYAGKKNCWALPLGFAVAVAAHLAFNNLCLKA